MFDRQKAKSTFRKAVKHLNRNPKELAGLFLLPPVSPTNQSNTQPPSGPREELVDNQGNDWGGVLTSWLDASEAAVQGNAEACCDSQDALHRAFNQLFSSIPGNLLIPTIISICKTTRKTAHRVDKLTFSSEFKQLGRCVNVLRDSFSKAINDRKEFVPNTPYSEDGSKKAGAVGIVNEIFAVYFMRKLDTVGNLAHRVTYRYFVGRLSLFTGDVATAEKSLDFAFTHCHKNALHNKRCILRYLIPVKILHGKLPRPSLLQKYGLTEFLTITESVRCGDIKSLNKALLDHQLLFIRFGTLLLLEQCKAICYRNLLKRIYTLRGTHLLDLKEIVGVLKWMEVHIDKAELECIIANLIQKVYVRGYMHHMRGILVLSKRSPFPFEAIQKGPQ